MSKKILICLLAVLFLVTPVYAQQYSNKNQSCSTKQCNPQATTKLYCNTDTTPPYDGPSPGGSCKECSGSTYDDVRCADSPGTTIPSPTTTSTLPNQPTTTTLVKPSTTTTTVATPPTTTTTIPLPTGVFAFSSDGCDLSISGLPKDGEALLYFDRCGTPIFANQVHRDEMESRLVYLAHQMMIRYRNLAPSAVKKAYSSSGLNNITKVLLQEYESRGLCTGNVCDLVTAAPRTGGGIWTVQDAGHHYSKERKVLHDIGKELQKKKIIVNQEDGQLLGIAPINFPPLPAGNPSASYLALGTLTTKPNLIPQLIPTTAQQIKALQDTERAHHQSILEALGKPTDPTAPTVSSAQKAYSNAMVSGPYSTEVKWNRLHFSMLKPFNGNCPIKTTQDGIGWTQDECVAWKVLTHVYHSRWVNAQRQGLWGVSRVSDNDHFQAHACMNDGDPRLLVLFSCQEKPGKPQNCVWPNGKRGAMTCQQFLQVLPIVLGNEYASVLNSH